MYINPFVAGIVVTIMVEMIIIIGYAIISSTKNKHK